MVWPIGEVARRTGLAASAIRFYERQGLISAPARRNGRRVYEAEILDRLTIIELAKRAGFTIAETRQLLHGFAPETEPGERWRALAESKIGELNRRIEEARKMKRVLLRATSCRCPTFEDCAGALGSRKNPPDPAPRRPPKA